MEAVLVDTDVFSYIHKGDTRAGQFTPYLVGKHAVLSFAIVGELLYWAFKSGWGEERIAGLERAIRRFVVVPYSEAVSRRWALVRKERDEPGWRIEANDAWIAATAIEYNCPILTNNRRDFEGITGLTVLS